VKVVWAAEAWDDYVGRQQRDKKVVKRINLLIRDIARDDESGGIGKPELLRGDLSGWASRRITEEHRLVYRARDGALEILSCRMHYEK
jgi:toxin YoeB